MFDEEKQDVPATSETQETPVEPTSETPAEETVA